MSVCLGVDGGGTKTDFLLMDQSGLLPRLNGIAEKVPPGARHRCGNDMVCGWAGALAGQDGINLVAGTGSIAYGEFAGREARAGGWGELFSDEGSAYWIARGGLSLFSRMSDGRAATGTQRARRIGAPGRASGHGRPLRAALHASGRQYDFASPIAEFARQCPATESGDSPA